MKRFRLITFDAYSGLADYRTTLRPVIARETGLDPGPGAAFLETWRARQLEAAALGVAIGRGRIPFRECTALALDYAARRHGVDIGGDRRDRLIAAWYPLEPWPEAGHVLATLRGRGYPVAILSNGDPDMLAAIADRTGVAFDRIFSAEEAGTYKPCPPIYDLPVRDMGITRADYLHVAGGAMDVVGARAAGVACYWNNRTGDSVLFPDCAATYEGPDLTGLLDIL